MHLTRLVFLAVTGCSLLAAPLLRAQTPPPWAPDKQFSTDETITSKAGMTVSGKTYLDNGKIRTEATMGGMSSVSIVRPDQSKAYVLMPAQKMMMVMPLDAGKMKQLAALSPDSNAKFDLVGPDTAEGVPSLKYKMTTSDGKVYDWWVNPTSKIPVKFAAEDGSIGIVFKNYKAGPQSAALFEPPTDYQLMQMPAGMGAPGGGAPAGQ